jgi:cobalt-precorrin 5A hydrolase
MRSDRQKYGILKAPDPSYQVLSFRQKQADSRTAGMSYVSCVVKQRKIQLTRQKKIIYLAAFSEDGMLLGQKLDMGPVTRIGSASGITLDQWTARAFREADALVFIGAAGIAVRAIAPYIKDKTEDPAVVVMDDCGTYVISMLSGHLGGANALAEEIAAGIGAEAVITTSTDRHRTFAADDWARKIGYDVRNPQDIKHISAALLQGQTAEIHAGDKILYLDPKKYILGVGCKKNILPAHMRTALDAFLKRHGLQPSCILALATIDRKAEEAAIQAACRDLHVPLYVFTAEELMALPGRYSASEFVRKTIGTDNVCERSSVLAAGAVRAGIFPPETAVCIGKEASEAIFTSARANDLVITKETFQGITFALAAVRKQ